MDQVSQHNLSKLKLYTEETPLFSRYQVEHQIDSAFSREVQLESGGSLVFDKTEALISIDVNSARATKGADIEETALNTNLEAAEEVARQLRLRDLGGLVVIDFIDMTPARNQRKIEQCLNDAMKIDRARVQIGRLSRFGLLELSRQRLRPSLIEANSDICPRCKGTGHVRSVLSISLNILRLIQDEAMKENTAAVQVQLPVDAATYLLNEKRHEISAIESKLGTPIIVVPTPDLQTPHYTIVRLKTEEYEEQIDAASHELEFAADDEAKEKEASVLKPAPEKAAVGQLTHTTTAPQKTKSFSLLSFLKKLFGLDGKAKPKRAHTNRRPSGGQRRRGSQNKNRTNQRNRNQRTSQQKNATDKRSPDNRSRNKSGRNNNDQDQSQNKSQNRNQRNASKGRSQSKTRDKDAASTPDRGQGRGKNEGRRRGPRPTKRADTRKTSSNEEKNGNVNPDYKAVPEKQPSQLQDASQKNGTNKQPEQDITQASPVITSPKAVAPVAITEPKKNEQASTQQEAKKQLKQIETKQAEVASSDAENKN